ncbi:MAG: hypothetical protein M1282_07415 [Chloroflexi bacterium]|nr:hypothetical protein [Chloroflexota bacterium]
MSTHYDEKGKIFTDIVKKEPIWVLIQTTTLQRIKGRMFVRPDERVKDELNHIERFLAVTDASVYEQDGNLIQQCAFIAVSRDQIAWLIPQEELVTEKQDIKAEKF